MLEVETPCFQDSFKDISEQLDSTGGIRNKRQRLTYHAVKMDRSVLVPKSIVHVDYQLIAFVDFDHWQRPFSIHTNNFSLLQPIWIGGDPSYIKVVSDGLSSAVAGKAHEQQCPKCAMRQYCHLE